jgi:capsular polysaccharide biosynthesis protein
VAIAAVIVITAVGDYRSFIGILALALLATVFGPLAVKSRVGLPRLLLGLVAIMFVLYQTVIFLSLGGFLGARNQRVTADQLAQGGSLLSAGRPEWHASIALFLKSPLGFGPGVTPTANDVNLGIAALSDAGVDTSTAQIRTYMFGGNLQLHSIAADLWVALGIGGLVLAVTLGVVVLKGAYREVREPKPWLALSMFLSILALWDIAFSPIETNLIEVCFAVGILLPSRSVDTRVPSLDAGWPSWMIRLVHSGKSLFHRGRGRMRSPSAPEVARPTGDGEPRLKGLATGPVGSRISRMTKLRKEHPLELTEYFSILRRYWRSIAALAAVGLVSASVLSLLAKPLYTATTSAIVTVTSGTSANELYQASAYAKAQALNYSHLIPAPLVLQPVIDSLGLGVSPAELAANVTSTVTPDTPIVTITVASPEADRSSAVANAIVNQLSVSTNALSPTTAAAGPVKVTVVQPAVAPLRPSSPNIPRNIALGLAIGIVLGVGQALGRVLVPRFVRRARRPQLDAADPSSETSHVQELQP